MKVDKVIEELEDAGFLPAQISRLNELAGDPPSAMVYKAALKALKKRDMSPRQIMELVEETVGKINAVLEPPQED